MSVTNDSMNYDWGSTVMIANICNRAETAKPEAEIWLGTHRKSPAKIYNCDSMLIHNESVKGQQLLSEWYEINGLAKDLEFLFKILAAEQPLSIQVHPTREQALSGYAYEVSKGIVDAKRNFTDSNHKPEIIISLVDGFEALVGFKKIDDLRDDYLFLKSVINYIPNVDKNTFATYLDGLLSIFKAQGNDIIKSILDYIYDNDNSIKFSELIFQVLSNSTEEKFIINSTWSVFIRLWQKYPLDRGVLLSTLMQYYNLTKDESLYIPAGEIHAYLGGLGVEVMATSDNVIRAGLTNKHVDAPTLLGIVNTVPGKDYLWHSRSLDKNITIWDPPVSEFVVYKYSSDSVYDEAVVELSTDDRIIGSVVAGCATIVDSTSELVVSSGEHFALISEPKKITIKGKAEVFFSKTLNHRITGVFE